MPWVRGEYVWRRAEGTVGPSGGWARVALVHGPDWTFAPTLVDALRMSGLVFRRYPAEQVEKACSAAHIVLVAPLPNAPDAASVLARHLEQGGSVICLGDPCGLEPYLGIRVRQEAPEFGEGYLRPIASHFVLHGHTEPIHCFGGTCAVAEDATSVAALLDRHGGETGLCGFSLRERGRSVAAFLSPELGLTAVRLEQGTFVEEDGVPAPDGSAPIRDGVLRSEDGSLADWQLDRTSTLPGEPPAFLLPAVDRLVGLVVRTVAYAAEKLGLPLLFVWPHRDGADGTVLVSIGTDGTDVAAIQAMLHQATLVGLRATWCVRSPGFGLDVAKALRVREHEVALQFEVEAPEDWARDHLAVQHTRLLRASGSRTLASVSIYDGRWRGRNDFWEWCARLNIEAEIGRLPMHAGNAGCLFGTYRPFRPARSGGSLIPVLSIPCIAADVGDKVSSARALELLDHVARFHGVAHYFFETRAFADRGVTEAFRNLTAHVRPRGLEWGTAQEIVERMKAVRTMRVEKAIADSGLTVALHPEYDMPEAALCIYGGNVVGATSQHKPLRVLRCSRYGLPCSSVVVDLMAQCPTYVTLEQAVHTEMAG